MRLQSVPAALGDFCDILGGVGALAAGGGALALAKTAIGAVLAGQRLGSRLRERGREGAAEALERFRAEAERNWRDWAGVERLSPGAAEAALADFDAYVAEAGGALAPSPARMVELRAGLLSEDRPPEAVERALAALLARETVAIAARRAPDFYADRPDRAASRAFLRGLAQGAFGALLAAPDFAATLAPAILDLATRKLDALADGQRAERAEIAREAAATRAAVAAQGQETREAIGRDLRAALAEMLPRGLTLAQAEAILARFGETCASADPARIAEILREKAEELAALKARLRELAGEGPQVAALRRDAAAAIDAGDFAAAREALLAARALDHAGARAMRESLSSARASEAATLARLAELARLRLDYADEAEAWIEAHDLAADAEPALRWRFAQNAARALTDQGVEFGDSAALNRAVVACREIALKLAPRAEDAGRWAATQAALGAALAALGEREHGVETLDAALRAHRAALTVRTRATAPRDWAETQVNLGRVLLLIGAREAEARRLREAVAAFEEVIAAQAPSADPVFEARTRNHLGNALKLLGQRARDPDAMRRAVGCYRAALRALRRRERPGEWAMVMSNLGAALRTLGAWERDPHGLRRAVGACRAALAATGPGSAQIDRGRRQAALANALQTLAQTADDPPAAEAAVAAYDAALAGAAGSDAEAPMDRAMARGNRGVALLWLAERMEAGLPRATRLCRALRDLGAAARAMRRARSRAHAAYYAERLDEAREAARSGAGATAR